MKVSIYGAGNQHLYVNKLKLPELFGGEPPYGGSRMAIEFAEAGHDVVLAEPDRNMLTEEMWDKVEKAGVKVTNNDIEAARHGEMHILFTPFGCYTIDIAKRIIPYVPRDAVLLTTCTISPIVLYSCLKYELRERKDIGISSLHPAAVPGTPQHDHYIIGGTSLDGKDYLTEEQLKKCIELIESVNKKAYVVPIDVVSAVSDMGVLTTAIALAGILEYYKVGRRIIGAPKKMVEQQIVMALQTLASLVATSGVYGLLKALNVELVTKSASSMNLSEDQRGLKVALDILNNIDEKFVEKAKKAKINPTTLVDSQALVNEIKGVVGEKAAEGIIERSRKKLFMG
ncbi:H(2)-dependent methylenetetrahydromethanopterin dehydrogenase-related protein [Methanothermococcus sp. SCGC AD-155-E23]|nr:H(2)-dependent methylenetetrahydromethanopterin dehydrogenase-related protein [Methanothermococcus sp. SCGC AD-155-E23]